MPASGVDAWCAEAATVELPVATPVSKLAVQAI